MRTTSFLFVCLLSLVLYGEDLAPTGLTAAELKSEGKAYDQCPAIETGLVERAQKQIKITR